MSLLDELTALDVTAVVHATASIRVTVNGQDLQALVEAGAVGALLGEVGTAVDTVIAAADDPQALLAPLGQAFESLAGGLTVDLPLPDLVAAVRDGARILAGLLDGADADTLVTWASSALADLGAPLLDHVPRVLDDLGQFRAVVDTVQAGLPTDPTALAGLAIDLLLPVGRADLEALGSGIRTVLAALDGVALPTAATADLVVALDAVTAAGISGDDTALRAALSHLTAVRATAVSTLGSQLRRLAADLAVIRVDAALAPVTAVSAGLRTARASVLDELDHWRRQVADARTLLADIDPDHLRTEVTAFFDQFETWVRAGLDSAIDDQVRELQAWLRGLFASLPLQALRQRVTDALAGVAATVRAAGLDAAARDLRAGLDAAQSAIVEADVAGQVRAAIAEVEAVVGGAIDDIAGHLAGVGAAVDAVAGEAQEVLERAAGALTAFARAVAEVQVMLDGAGLREAGQQVGQRLAELRATAEQVLSVAPLPESMRPAIDQLVATVESIDVRAALDGPLREAAAQLELPAGVGADIDAGLEAASVAVRNLVPQALIADLEAAVADVVAELRALDPTALLGDVTGVLADAAAALDRLDPGAAAAAVQPAFDAVLAAVDAVHPRRVLDPVIRAYDEALGAVTVPDPDATVQRLAEATAAAGTEVARAATQPLTRLVPEAEVTDPADEPAAAATPPLPGVADVRPGDVIRVLGWLPARLREGVAALGGSQVGAVLAELDAVTAGLARDLRRLATAVTDVGHRLDAQLDTELTPVGTAQVRAQLTLRARADSAGSSAQLDADLALVASVSPAELRAGVADDLAAARGQLAEAAGALTGETAGRLEATAAALDRTRLAGLVGDLDGLLAALDPEPIAAEIDALVADALARAPDLVASMGDLVLDLQRRIEALVRHADPGRLLQRFLPVVEVLREQVALLDPSHLADELGEVHAAVRGIVAAYDPAAIAADLRAVIEAIAGVIRSLDPAELLGDLSGLDAAVSRVAEMVPTEALAGVGADLEAVGDQLLAVDLDGLIAAVNGLGPAMIDLAGEVAAGIQQEVLALLGAIRYASANASVSVSVQAGTA